VSPFLIIDHIPRRPLCISISTTAPAPAQYCPWSKSYTTPFLLHLSPEEALAHPRLDPSTSSESIRVISSALFSTELRLTSLSLAVFLDSVYLHSIFSPCLEHLHFIFLISSSLKTL
jgi:hypothetical protein